MMRGFFKLCLLFALVCVGAAEAHKPSESFLSLDLKEDVLNVQVSLALRDLDYALGLDLNGDYELSWGELKAKEKELNDYVLSRLIIKSKSEAKEKQGHHYGANEGHHHEKSHSHGHHHKKSHSHGHSHSHGSKDFYSLCRSFNTELLVDNLSDGAYAVLKISYNCGEGVQSIFLKNNILFDLDPKHKCLFKFTGVGHTSASVLSSDDRIQKIRLSSVNSIEQFKKFINQGLYHIWTGFDHILFLLALLLPAVFIPGSLQENGINFGAIGFFRKKRLWDPSESFKISFWTIFKIVTAFTIAHSITLSLATLGLLAVNSRIVESIIAFSVALAALNNLYPNLLNNIKPAALQRANSAWMIAFIFGLVHGLGFASVLGDLDLPKLALVASLVAFNLGVELGQMAIVLIFVPFAFMLRKTAFYEKVIFQIGSYLIVLIAALWFIERVFELSFLAF